MKTGRLLYHSLDMIESDKILADKGVDELITRALEEDIQTGDVTTNAIIDSITEGRAEWKAKDNGIIAGLELAEAVFKRLDIELSWEAKFSDGNKIADGDVIVKMKGKTRALLTAERTALNFVQRMSGIATETNRYVTLLEDFGAHILDTRKTVPGLRLLDKYAVKMGGGENHRMGLYDLAMIKDNHIISAGSIANAVERVRQAQPALKIEVETKNLEEVKEALAADADIIMLDNMDPSLMSRAVEVVNDKALTEASGNITLENIRTVAEAGVDFISVGALTHSVKAFDISQIIISN